MRMNYDLSTFRKNFEIFQLQIAPREGKRFSEPDRHYLWRLQKSTIDWSGPFLGWCLFRVSLVCSGQQWFGGYFLWFLLIFFFIIILFFFFSAFALFLSSLTLSFYYLWLNSLLQTANKMTRMQQEVSLDIVYWKAFVANTVVGNPMLGSFKTSVETAQEQIQ